jgi:hypothetical protein
MIDSYSHPRLKGLIAAATDCLQAIARKAEEEARRVHSLTLTDEEREAIKQAIHIVDWQQAYFSHAGLGPPLPSATLRSLLERASKGTADVRENGR